MARNKNIHTHTLYIYIYIYIYLTYHFVMACEINHLVLLLEKEFCIVGSLVPDLEELPPLEDDLVVGQRTFLMVMF